VAPQILPANSIGNPAVYGYKFIIFFLRYSFNGVHVFSRPCLSSTHVSSASIQSFPYAQSTLYYAVYAHWLHHICHMAHPPVNVHYLYIYGTRDVSRGGVRSTRIQFMWLCFTNFSPCVRWPRARSPLLTFDDGRL